MKKALQHIDSINNWLGNIASYSVLAITILMLTEVVMRYFFRRPTLWIWDMNMQFFAIMVFMGAGYHVYTRQIISVDIFYERFPRIFKIISDLISFFCMLLFLGVTIWKTGEYAWRSLLLLEHSTTPFGPPIFHLKMMIPLGVILMLLQFTKQFIEEFSAHFKEKGAEENGD